MTFQAIYINKNIYLNKFWCGGGASVARFAANPISYFPRSIKGNK